MSAGLGLAHAQTDRDAIERIERQATERQQRDASAMAPLAASPLTAPGASSWQPPMLGEVPCFTVHKVLWADPARPALAAHHELLRELPGYEGACLGAKSLERLRANLDARLLAAGYVTSRVLIPPQSLDEGLLRIDLQLGRIGRIVHRGADAQVRAVPFAWLPFAPGDVLNLREIEQALESAARLPSLAAQVAIEPGDEPGLSNLVFVHAASARWRGQFSVDNEGLRDFGRWQVASAGVIDLGWLGADQLSVWHQRSARGWSPEALQQRTNVNYSAGLGRHLLSLSLSQAQHRRRIQGTTLAFAERGKEHTAQLQLQRVLMRASNWRLSSTLAASGRQARTFIEDTELLLQRRRSRDWEWGLAWQQRAISHDLGVQLQRRQVRSNNPRIDLLPEPIALPRHDSLSVDFQRPVQLWGAAGSYQARAQWHWVQRPAYGADLQGIGGGASVRGFDGGRQLIGLRSGVLRQDLALAPALLQSQTARHQVLLSLDIGQVGGLSAEPARDRRLVGMALALRTQWGPSWTQELSWDAPLHQPRAWPDRPSRLRFQLTGSF